MYDTVGQICLKISREIHTVYINKCMKFIYLQYIQHINYFIINPKQGIMVHWQPVVLNVGLIFMNNVKTNLVRSPVEQIA